MCGIHHLSISLKNGPVISFPDIPSSMKHARYSFPSTSGAQVDNSFCAMEQYVFADMFSVAISSCNFNTTYNLLPQSDTNIFSTLFA